MPQQFDVALLLLDDMKKVIQAWNTREDQVSSQQWNMNKKQIKKHDERDEKLVKW